MGYGLGVRCDDVMVFVGEVYIAGAQGGEDVLD